MLPSLLSCTPKSKQSLSNTEITYNDGSACLHRHHHFVIGAIIAANLTDEGQDVFSKA